MGILLKYNFKKLMESGDLKPYKKQETSVGIIERNLVDAETTLRTLVAAQKDAIEYGDTDLAAELLPIIMLYEKKVKEYGESIANLKKKLAQN